MKRIKKAGLLWFCFLLLLLSGMEIKAGAAGLQEQKNLSTAEKLEQAAGNVMRVELIYRKEEGSILVLHEGSGFLIGDGEEAPQYLLTANSVVSFGEEEKKQLQKEEWKESSTEIRVVVRQDVTVEASVVKKSEEIGFALLHLEQPIYDRNYMVLNTTFGEPEGETEIYSIGIAKQSEDGDAAQISRGKLFGAEESAGTAGWMHDSYSNPGYTGGPLTDAEGTVLGLNQSNPGEKLLEATRITELLPVLDALGIPYRTTAMEQNERQEMQQQLRDASQSAARAGVLAAEKIPDTESKAMLVLGILSGIFLILGAVLLITLVLTKEKRAAKRRKRKEEMTVTQAAPVFDRGAWAQGEAVLVRMKTGQRERLRKERFLLGKERSSTDFYIGDNSAVSRRHACILKKADGFWVVDLQATNGTFLNGERLHPGTERLLKGGDRLRLADEDFEFLNSGG